MALNHTKSRFFTTLSFPLHPNYLSQTGVSYVIEGMALINSLDDRIGKVRPSTGSAADGTFVGFASEINRTQTSAVAVEEVTVPSSTPYSVDLAHAATSLNSITLETDAGAELNVRAGAADASNAQWLAANPDAIVFHSTHAGDTFTVYYRYSPTVEEVVSLYGHGNVQGATSPGAAANSMTVITEGIVYTDQFDTGDFWNVADTTTLHSKANGLLGLSGGEVIPAGRIQIVEAPSVNVPFLGVYLR